MPVKECNLLHETIINRIKTWPPDPVNNNLISNLSYNLNYISNNFTYNLSNISANFGNYSNNSTKINSTENQLNKSQLNNKIIQNQNSIQNVSNLKSPTQPNEISENNLNGLNINQLNNSNLDEELITLIEKLNEKALFLQQNGEKHDYTGKQINGYFSMLRILERYFTYVISQMDKKKRKFSDFYEVGSLLLHVLNAMQDYSKKYQELRVRFLANDFNPNFVDSDDEFIDEEIEKQLKKTSSNDSDDDLDDENNFEEISSNLIQMSTNLANSIESMKSNCENALEDIENNNGNFNHESDDENNDNIKKEKISDYYLKNEPIDNEIIDKEYGKEIKKEEYETTLQKYYKRFNFNFKLSKTNTCISPVRDESSPKKVINSFANQTNRPESPKKIQTKPPKYYKYFSNLTKNFEENLSRLTSYNEQNIRSINDEYTNSTKSKTDQNGSNKSKVFENNNIDDGDVIELEETEKEKKVRDANLDEYILSKFNDTNDNLHLITPPMLYFFEGFTLTLNCEKELSLIYGRVGAFWYCKSAANIVNLVRNLIVILTSPPSKSIASLCNTDYCGRVFAHRQVNATLDSLLQGLASLEVKALNKRYFKFKYREHVIYGKTIKIPVHSEFILPRYGNNLKKTKTFDSSSPNDDGNTLNIYAEKNNKTFITKEMNDVKEFVKQNCDTNDNFIELDDTSETLNDTFNSRSVRCRLINYVRGVNESEVCENSHKCLLFHVHGGGFVLSSPDSHELYLRDWAVKLKGIPILSIDYVLRKPYPSAPQDILDVYMTLVDPKKQQLITEMIGFQPDKLVLAGDSAGANLIFSLICCLNEIRKQFPEYSNIKMPTSIISIYGAFDIRAVMSPSKFISSIDPILHHGNIMAMIGTYGGISQKIRKTLWSRIKNRRSIAWYRCSEKELKRRFKQLSKTMESYFASPLTYPRYEDLKEISIHLISTHLCPLIDDSVIFYKIWKGEITFDIFDGLPHAFLNFSDRSEEAKIATDKCAELIIDAFKKK